MLQIAQEIVYFAHINSNHIMKVINFAETNSILNQYVAEIRDVQVQNDRLRFRRNIERIGEIMAYEMSKEFAYSQKNIQTPLGIAPVQTPDNQLVLSTILRAGLPFHQGFLSYFDGAENAFVSAYRKYKDTLKFDIHIEYIASPRIDGKTLIITDPMLATGSSMELRRRFMSLLSLPVGRLWNTLLRHCLQIRPPFGVQPLIRRLTSIRILFRDWGMQEIWLSAKRNKYQ